MKSADRIKGSSMQYLNDMPIAVLGDGSVGQACASDIRQAGREVRLFDLMTSGNYEAVKGAGLIVVAAPAMAHEPLFRSMIPYLEDGQVIHIFTDNYGTLLFRRLMRELNCDKRVIVGGWSSAPYGIRLGKANAKYKAVTLRGASMPMTDIDDFMESSRHLPCLDAVIRGSGPSVGNTVLDIGFANLNPVVHVPVSILGVSTQKSWDLVSDGHDRTTYSVYNHGPCPQICEIQYQFYEEEKSVASAIGIIAPNFTYESFFSSPSVLIQEYAGKETGSAGHDSLIEDVAVNCKIYHDLGAQYGVATPIIDSMIILAGAMYKENFFQSSKYDLAYLGIDNMSKEELLDYLNIGIYKR